ncbi:MAG: DUF2911 domain-containing protein [Cyclobacteriaceae bacterium]|nr:DUF2911 domain-containing protein [Cyclobacteriaceae bacterium SS2]
MRIYLLLFLFAGSSSMAFAQNFRGLDKSPMDAAYLPDNYAHDRDPGEKAVIKIYYSRPQKNDRDIFGSKVPYGKVWRLGANESAEFKAYQDITIGGKQLKAGTYSIFAIPEKDQWTIIFNSDLDYWGAYSYNEKNDVLRITSPVKPISADVEAFSIQFEEKGDNAAILRMAWDKTLVEIAVSF